MKKLSCVLYLERTANVIFPNHLKIQRQLYLLMRTQYFDSLKLMDVEIKNLHFENTYYADGRISWFVFKGFRYFFFIMNGGTSQECKYYGRITCEF